MSDPIAVSILSKLTSWYPFDGNANDAHGTNHLTLDASPGYEAGLKSQQIIEAARGACLLSPQPAFAPVAGSYSIGGWFDFTAGAVAQPEFGLFYPTMSAGAEAFVIVVNPAGFFYAITWHDAGTNNSVVQDPLSGAVNYPVRVRVQDSVGQTADSDQVIRVTGGGGTMVPGRYFVVATWDAGNRVLYVDSVAVDTNTPPAAVKESAIGQIGIGRTGGSPASSLTAQDECFVCMDGALTAAEVTWLYNSGNGRSYAEVVAAAA